MPDYRLNKPIIKMTLERDRLHNLRDWLLLRRHYPRRSGLFTLDELAGVYDTLEINILADRSNLSKFKKKKREQFKNSYLIKHIKGDTYKFMSMTSALVEYKGSAKHTAYTISESSLMRSGAFLEACIGIILTGGGYSNAGAAKLFNISKRRIQKATKQNDKTGLVEKRFNKVLEFYPSEHEAFQAHDELKAHGIESSMPFKLNKNWCITLNSVNGYKSHTLKRFKGKKDRGKFRASCSTPGDWKTWFIPVYKGKGARSIRKKTEIEIQGRALMFNDPVYHIGSFILDHSVII